MGRNKWDIKELTVLIKTKIDEFGDINTHDFPKYGLPCVSTCCKLLGLKNSKQELYKYIGIEFKIKYENTLFVDGKRFIKTDLPLLLSTKGKNKNKLIVDWSSAVGMDVIIEDKGVDYNVYIESYNAKTHKLGISYDSNSIFDIATDSFRKGYYGELLKVRTKDFRYEIGDVIGKLSITNIYMHNDKKRYGYICLNCENEDSMTEYNIRNGKSCNVCSTAPKKLLTGVNDMATTSPWMKDWLLNEDEAYVNFAQTSKKLWFKCVDCGNEKFISCNSFNRYGMACNKCSDGKSYSEKFMYSFLEQLNIEFVAETSFDWSKNIKYKDKITIKRYDFYIPSLNMIIETHGIQHYEHSGFKNTLEEEQYNDNFKMELALNNNIKYYLPIDCRYNDVDFIKNNILNSPIAKLFNLESIDWNICREQAAKNLIKMVCSLWNDGYRTTTSIEKVTKIPRSRVCIYLKIGADMNWCDYSAKTWHSENSKIMSVLSCGKPLICLENEKVYLSTGECERNMNSEYGINLHRGNIGVTCNGK